MTKNEYIAHAVRQHFAAGHLVTNGHVVRLRVPTALLVMDVRAWLGQIARGLADAKDARGAQGIRDVLDGYNTPLGYRPLDVRLALTPLVVERRDLARWADRMVEFGAPLASVPLAKWILDVDRGEMLVHQRLAWLEPLGGRDHIVAEFKSAPVVEEAPR